MSFEQNLAKVVSRHEELSELMADPRAVGKDGYIKLSKEFSQLSPIVAVINEWQKACEEMAGLENIIAEDSSDSEMKILAEEEFRSVKARMPELENRVKLMLIPKDEVDSRNAILEVRAGTGGDEAALFAADVFRMYQRYADVMNWKHETLQVQETGIGGFKEATAIFSGSNVFARLKFESGVHRVQRVPITESSGRIHTSAVTVAVMPEAEQVDVEIKDSDLRIDTFRAQGAGGQHVNTTDSAVRITHVPTGIVVSQQDEKSQHKNKAKALKVLRARIFELERLKIELERAQTRKEQVGTGDRSERIRTYNFPERRITDHRINLTVHSLNSVLEGNLNEIIDALATEEQAAKLAEIQ